MPISFTQINHILRNIKQKLFGIKVSVIGGYHGGNLGDMALGDSVITALKNQKIKTGLQTIYNLEKWPVAPFAIVGGGAVGYAESLTKVARRYNNNLQNVALLGVDFNEENYSDECMQLIKNAAYVSGRSEAQAIKLGLISGRKDIKFHPDIAFSLYMGFCKRQRDIALEKKSKKLLVNIVPLYGKIIDGEIVPSEQYRLERPELHKSFDLMHKSYRTFVRSVVKRAILDGYEVESIPFTHQDGEFGKMILDGLSVKHNIYHSDPLQMIKYMASSQLILATRYHATIFGLKLGIPLIPIAYAVKNELLLKELGVSRSSFLSTDDLAKGSDGVTYPITVKPEIIEKFETASANAINESIKALEVFI